MGLNLTLPIDHMSQCVHILIFIIITGAEIGFYVHRRPVKIAVFKVASGSINN